MRVGVVHDHGDQINVNATYNHDEPNDQSHIYIHPLNSITCQRIFLPLFHVIKKIKKRGDPKTLYARSMQLRALESQQLESHRLSPSLALPFAVLFLTRKSSDHLPELTNTT